MLSSSSALFLHTTLTALPTRSLTRLFVIPSIHCITCSSVTIPFFPTVLQNPRRTNFLFTLLLHLAGHINFNPGPPCFINFSHLSVRSASSVIPSLNKPAVLQDFIADHNLEILALSETWLHLDTLPPVLNSLTPDNFSIIHSPRLHGTGGGLTFIYRFYLKIVTVSMAYFSSFESLCVRLTVSSSSFTILVIYRTPSSSLATFNSEFATLLRALFLLHLN